MCVDNYDHNKAKFLKSWNLMFAQYIFKNQDDLKTKLKSVREIKEEPIFS
jgi:hypothetical protein